jgi:hypothetical protein
VVEELVNTFRAWRCGLLAAITGIVGLALGADLAQASCGDYVHVSPQAATAQKIAETQHPTQHSSRLPCSGPQCSRAPDRAPIPPTEAVVSTAKNWASPSLDLVQPELNLAGWIAVGPPLLPFITAGSSATLARCTHWEPRRHATNGIDWAGKPAL